MNDSIYLSIQNSPRFKELVSKRERFAWILSAIMLGLYSGFILVDRLWAPDPGRQTQP